MWAARSGGIETKSDLSDIAKTRLLLPIDTEIWTYAHDPESSSELEMVNHVDLDWMKDDFVVTYGAFVVVGREQREVVRAVRFKID